MRRDSETCEDTFNHPDAAGLNSVGDSQPGLLQPFVPDAETTSAFIAVRDVGLNRRRNDPIHHTLLITIKSLLVDMPAHANCSLMTCFALISRVLTVPIGMPRSQAASRVLKPSKMRA